MNLRTFFEPLYRSCPSKTEGELPLENEPDSQSPPHTHEWGLWEIVKEDAIIRYNTVTYKDDEIGSYLDQQRRCTTCGKYELDTQVTYLDDYARF